MLQKGDLLTHTVNEFYRYSMLSKLRHVALHYSLHVQLSLYKTSLYWIYIIKEELYHKTCNFSEMYL